MSFWFNFLYEKFITFASIDSQDKDEEQGRWRGSAKNFRIKNSFVPL